MNTPPMGPHRPGLYEIRLEGRLHERWSAWFDGMTLTSTPAPPGTGPGTDPGDAGDDVITTLRGPVVDQAALHGILARLRDFGMTLVSVVRIEPD